MIYPQLTGEPNFVLIGVSAVFGLLVIIIVYYIFISKNQTNQPQNKSLPYNQINTMNTLANSIITSSNPTQNSAPVNINSSYSSIPTTAPAATLSNPTLNQVFNIKENIYTLDDASGVCGALGADVATINQLIDAHKTGADWCNVGWTKDGLAAYPIQYSTWKNLQDNNPGSRDICGVTGINLVRNDPNLLYGVNCYGIKPEPKGNEKVKQVMLNDKQIAMNAKIAQFQKNINAIGVAPFNSSSWTG
jgi:hypothetical protein